MNLLVENLAEKIEPVDDFFVPATETELISAEAQLGVRLPDTLRAIQLRYGRFLFSGEATIHTSPPRGEKLGVFTFFGCTGETGNLLSDFDLHEEFQKIPLIPIADDMFNNRYVWNSVSQRVLFIDYSTGEPAREVASSFDEFLEKIEVIPD